MISCNSTVTCKITWYVPNYCYLAKQSFCQSDSCPSLVLHTGSGSVPFLGISVKTTHSARTISAHITALRPQSPGCLIRCHDRLCGSEADLGFFRSRGHNGATVYREGPSLSFKSNGLNISVCVRMNSLRITYIIKYNTIFEEKMGFPANLELVFTLC